MVVTFKEENTAAFKHLFLKDYQDDTPQAVHMQKELHSHVDFAIEQVAYQVSHCVLFSLIPQSRRISSDLFEGFKMSMEFFVCNVDMVLT